MSLSGDTRRKYVIIDALTRLDKPSISALIEETKIPEPTLKRQIGLLRKEYQMDIRFVRSPEATGKGRTGYYMIVDWGIINRTAFMSAYGGKTDDI